jgi:type II secretion system (T2SS) protein C
VSRRLLAVNVLVGLLGCLFAAALVRELLTPLRLPPPAPRAAQPARVAPPAPTARTAGGSYAVVASRNLFSPTRSEAAAGPAVAAGPKPYLHGVVMNGGKNRAFLEDPAAKRTFGYSVGDAIAGGRVQSISADRVVIARPGGLLEVPLQDPGKPRPSPTTPPAGPGAAPGAGAPAAGTLPARRTPGAAPESGQR